MKLAGQPKCISHYNYIIQYFQYQSNTPHHVPDQWAWHVDQTQHMRTTEQMQKQMHVGGFEPKTLGTTKP